MAASITIPRAADRMNRILKFMDSYLTQVEVQIAALDTVISFARNGDSVRDIRDTEMIPVVLKCLALHRKVAKVVWRACLALSILARSILEVSVAITEAEPPIYEVLVEEFNTFQTAPLVQQQILWFIAALLSWPRSKLALHKSEKSMDFFKALIDRQSKRKTGTPRTLFLKGIGSISSSTMTMMMTVMAVIYLGTGKDPARSAMQQGKKPKKRASVVGALFGMIRGRRPDSSHSSPALKDEAEVMVGIVLPVQLLSFYRESEGQVFRPRRKSSKVCASSNNAAWSRASCSALSGPRSAWSNT